MLKRNCPSRGKGQRGRKSVGWRFRHTFGSRMSEVRVSPLGPKDLWSESFRGPLLLFAAVQLLIYFRRIWVSIYSIQNKKRSRISAIRSRICATPFGTRWYNFQYTLEIVRLYQIGSGRRLPNGTYLLQDRWSQPGHWNFKGYASLLQQNRIACSGSYRSG